MTEPLDVDPPFYLKVGDCVRFSKTVAESDVYLFAGITGDLAPVHTNQQYMKDSFYGQRIVHGVLIMGFMSTASSMVVARCALESDTEVPVSLGYDHVRFLGAALIGDTVTVDYRVTAIDPARSRSTADIQVHNQDDRLIAVATHVLKWVRNDRTHA
ncbi:MAG TPA: MaoC/PaaZ C-terminal domain-containing protein [Castellaniella sp.]|uniref:MaoC family dehydratase n=1 Tax=Castellaniella sp. TaxID=1955812 RepID=UPI002EFA6AE7